MITPFHDNPRLLNREPAMQTASIQGKSNKPMMILSALGILFVVDGHTGNGIGLMASVFPYGSFFMPLFMFVSGYFWKAKVCESWKQTVRYLLHKFSRLMVPYLLWSAVYALAILALNGMGMAWQPIGFRELIYSICTDGTAARINGAAWFVPALFAVIAAYTCLRKVVGRVWRDFPALVVFLLLGTATVSLTHIPAGVYHKALLLYKMGFFLFFFHLGQCFRNGWERKFDRIGTLQLCVPLILINLLVLSLGESVDLGRLALMCDIASHYSCLPFLTASTGILFWWKVAKGLVPILGENRLVNFISNNTFFIMMHHVMVIFLINGLLLLGKICGVSCLGAFDIKGFLEDPWYLYHAGPWMNVLYFLLTVAGTLALCKIYLRLQSWICEKRKQAHSVR